MIAIIIIVGAITVVGLFLFSTSYSRGTRRAGRYGASGAGGYFGASGGDGGASGHDGGGGHSCGGGGGSSGCGGGCGGGG